jgi:hypothetical protein
VKANLSFRFIINFPMTFCLAIKKRLRALHENFIPEKMVLKHGLH